ncbi:hypothetical protein OIU77_022515 [Salix suchowensis]|uniref:Uncharacterized protein n=1 Tax=Salix suchowensis TaxID=1278906 RepID=A0ABQ9C1C3_9ROSI|nr:hypothetical protein OIU77_022515 [Salix suchowensis]
MSTVCNSNSHRPRSQWPNQSQPDRTRTETFYC